MTPQQITDAWRISFGSMGPAGFLCRHALQDRWVRIHSLPESKRYPDNEFERSEVIRRHLEVAESTLGSDSESFLFVTRFGEATDVLKEGLPGLSGFRFANLSGLSIDDEDDSTHFFCTPFTCDPGKLHGLILASANEETGPILFANFDRRTAYAPYDGGADLFFPSRELAAAAKERWSSWLSARDDGL